MKRKNGLKRYLRAVQSLLSGGRAEKRALLEQVRLVLLELPSAEALTAEEISALAGTPAEMVSIHAEQSVETLLKRRYKRSFKRVLLAGGVVLVFMLTAFFGVRYSAQILGYDAAYTYKTVFTAEEKRQNAKFLRQEKVRAYYEKIGREIEAGRWDGEKSAPEGGAIE